MVASVNGAHRRRVDDGSLPVDAIGTSQPRRQLRVQPLPYAHGLPVAQASPARHAAHAHLRGQVLPLDTSLEYEDDASEAAPQVCRLAPRMVPAAWLGWGQQRPNDGPEFIVNQWSGHSDTSFSRRVRQARRHLPCRYLVRAFKSPLVGCKHNFIKCCSF